LSQAWPEGQRAEILSTKYSENSSRNYFCEIFGEGFLKTTGVWWHQVAGDKRDMWEVVMGAAQSPALQWTVVAGAVLALVYKVLSSGEGLLMGDMYRDELDT